MAERRIVSVLFADVVGFTSLSESLDPEDLAIVQDAYFGAVRDVLDRYQGVLEKFIGDAAVAVFGTPRASADDAERAVRGALALHAAVATLAARLGLEPGTLRLRVGVNTGEVAYSPDDERVTGDAVNVAARLQSAAPPGRVAIGPDTALAVAEIFELEPLGGVDLKGKADPVRGSLVAGIRADPSRDAALGRLHSVTIGRRADLEALTADLYSATTRWSMVVAPPGVGKSRLVREFVSQLRSAEEHVRILACRCAAAATGPYQPVADLLVEALRASGLDPTQRGHDLAAAARPLLQGLVAGAGTPNAAFVIDQSIALLSGADASSGTERNARFAAWSAAFGVLEAGVRTLWVVEDAHDASLDALSYLRHASADPTDRHILLTARPALLGHDTAWADVADGARTGRLHHLEPLGPQEGASLVQSLTGASLPEDVVERIVAASDGNPLFVEELLRTWLILGVLADGPEGLALARTPGQVTVPTTVQILYAAQLDDLPDAARNVAQRGAVLGRTFPVEGLRLLVGEPAIPGLTALADRAIVEGPVEEPLGAAWNFRHALLRDTAYQTLGRNDRAALHVRVAGWLQDADPDGRQHPGLVAEHYAMAITEATRLLDPIGDVPRDEVTRRAQRWRLLAARAALDASAFDAARRQAEALLELLDDEPDDHPLQAPAAEALGTALTDVDLGQAAGWLARAITAYQAMLAADDAGDRRDEALGHVRASLRLASVHYDQLAFDQTVAVAERSLATVGAVLEESDLLSLRAWRLRGVAAMADASSEPEILAEIDHLLAGAREFGDDDALFDCQAVQMEYGAVGALAYPELVRGQAELAERLGRWSDLVVLRRIEAATLVGRDTNAGLVAARTVPTLARSLGLSEAEAFALYGVVEAAVAAGAWDEAIEVGERAFELAEAHSAGRAWVRTSFALMPVVAARGRTDLVERIVAHHEAQRAEHPPLSDYARVMLSGVRRWAGLDPLPGDEPRPEDIAALLPGSGVASGACQTEIALHAWLATGRHADVHRVLELAVTGQDAGASQGLLTRASHGLITAWYELATGDLPAARSNARAAVDDARACGAPWWEARALRVLEAAGPAEAEHIERRVRLEMALGVQHPQPPPMVASGPAGA